MDAARTSRKERSRGRARVMAEPPAACSALSVASLAAAYMSTISTHLNWGASYVVDDVYRRFLVPDADERHYVTVGRITTVGLRGRTPP